MARAPFVINGEEIAPGERRSFALPLPGQSPFTPVSMPVHVIHGRRSGPVLFLSAALHGDEINGIEIIRQILLQKSLARLRGTLICVPIVNMFGFLNHTRYLPDRRDLNRSFPGALHGSLASRTARVFAQEIVDRSDYGIDLHTGANHRNNLPHVRTNLEDERCHELAVAFGTPVIINANLRDGSLRQYALDQGIPMLLYEAGEALRFDPLSIRAGVRGILNVMRKVEMLRTRPKRGAKEHPVIEAKMSRWVRAPQTGLLRTSAKLGERIERGAPIGVIADPLGENETPVVAPFTGIIIGRNNLPAVNEGDALFHMASFADSLTVEGTLETFHEDQLEGLAPGDYV
ncbi:MAG: succinylglutamate desuccinylase [Alphaproteobacteria bacterium]|nr:MAG: succinylglutamate desuccinylase [Alphaproteobacteria bacterium]